jgi:hypothetical protein
MIIFLDHFKAGSRPRATDFKEGSRPLTADFNAPTKQARATDLVCSLKDLLTTLLKRVVPPKRGSAIKIYKDKSKNKEKTIRL